MAKHLRDAPDLEDVSKNLGMWLEFRKNDIVDGKSLAHLIDLVLPEKVFPSDEDK